MLPLAEVLRIARVLHRIWATRPHSTDHSHAGDEFDRLVDEVHQARRRIHLATRHGLTGILPMLREELKGRLDGLARQAERFRTQIDPPAPVPDLSDWIRDLRQLEAEFGPVTIRWTDQVLRVITEPIVLGGIHLGPFAIEFGWESSRRFQGARSFEIVAIEPNPALGREDVIHPHVDGGRLCAGDAADSLRQAVEEGRIADAFLIVKSVLAHYNPGSPYVPLAEWNGFHCSNCGRRRDADERSGCQGCGVDLCDECTGSCYRCSEIRCADCLIPCAICDDRFCRNCQLDTDSGRLVCNDCRTTCSRCRAVLATDEWDEESGCCGECVLAIKPSTEPEPEVTHAD